MAVALEVVAQLVVVQMAAGELIKNSHCSYCGCKFEEINWPRTCTHCMRTSWINPLPVTAIVVPIVYSDAPPYDKQGVLLVRRGEDPGAGELALPGGYLDVGETWQVGALRELQEETGLVIDGTPETKVKLLTVETSIRHNSLLVFCRSVLVTAEKAFANFRPSHEVKELVVVHEPIELAFPTHTKVLAKHFTGEF